MLLWTIAAASATDYTCDGFDDLLVGTPYELLTGYPWYTSGDDGMVHLLRGSASGLTAVGGRGFLGSSLAYLGDSLGGGDLDGDGCAELVLGAYESNPAAAPYYDGAVFVVRLTATPTSVTIDRRVQLTQDTPGVLETGEGLDLWGAAVVVADFDGDGYEDLVVGAPQETGNAPASGLVHFLRGDAGGLGLAGQRLYTQDSPDVLDVDEQNDMLGQVLVAGDFDADGYADLAIGVPYESSVHVMYGGTFGPSVVSPDDVRWTGIPYTDFGAALAVGDFDADGYDDLAVGAPYDDPLGPTDGGRVTVLHGSASGLAAAGTVWSQDSGTVADAVEPADGFGGAVAAGDLDGDGYDDLAIGAPYEHYATVFEDGLVHVLFGGAGGVGDAGNVTLSPATFQTGDHAGWSLTTGDYDADGFGDLVVGVPGFDNDSGAVDVYPGSATGPSAGVSARFTQDSPGVPNLSEDGEAFGWTVY